MKFQSNAIFNGTITANSVADAGTNTDKFLVLNSSGIVTYRTAAELYADLNIANLPAGSTSTVKHLVKAGVAVTKGQAVYVTSADGTNMIIGKASNASEATSSKTMGLIESTLAINGQGNVITEGLLAGLDTTGANAAGDPVWLGVDGNLIYGLANKPYAPAHLVFIGIVTRINANNGEIFVKVQNGFELKEIHDVDLITTTPVNGHILGYNGTLWVNKTIAGWLGFTPVTSARTLTINGVSYDLSADRSWTIEGGGGGTSASTRTVQKYTADGTTATYTVTGGYTVGMVDVYVNGIKLDNASGVEFTATNGTTVVLTSTPASGDIIEVYKYGSQFIANNALRQVTAFTATATQTVFTVNYSVGYVDVFYNGSKLAASEYTAINGTSITLATPCVANDIVEVVAYSYTVGAFTGVGGSGTANYISKFTASGTIGNSLIFDNGTIVGIGTSSPSLAAGIGLSIYNSNGQTRIALKNNTTGDGANDGFQIAISGDEAILDQRENSPLRFTTNAIERMRISANGNVGIGTNAPNDLLEVSGGFIRLSATAGNGPQFNIYSNGQTSNHITLAQGFALATDNIGYLYNRANADFVFGTNNAERLRITSSGNVGIGKTPSNKALEIYQASDAALRIQNSTTGTGNNDGLLIEVGGSNVLFDNYESGYMAFATADTERMRITSGGNVLIGTTSSPSAYGLVAIRGTNQGLTIQDAVSNGYRSLYFQSGNLYFYNGTNEGYLSSGGTWVNASDITLKKDVKDIEYGLDSVMQLKPKWYRMIEDDLEQIGFIAQDVEEVVPELVSTSEKGMKGLSYGQLTAVLVKAIQEQQAQIDDLKKLIN